MRRSRLFTLLFLGLLVAGVGLGWLIYQQLEASLPPEDKAPARVKAAEIPPLPPLPEFTMAPLIEFAEVTDRPAFSQTRRPPAEAAAPAAEVVASSLELVLKGVIFSEGQSVALFAPKAGGEVLRLAEGGSYQGWDLVEVSPSEVLFRRGEREETLELAFETAPSYVPRRDSRQRVRDRRDTSNRSSRRDQRAQDAFDRDNGDEEDQDSE
ncbi:MAG TPA: type II secretion system protein N [Kiloniellaceae bacterium]|nr:type II secretion system protein N [Kiloniellaceae bacterium]